jgi:pyrroloquinoline quinone biosynthesis protein E
VSGGDHQAVSNRIGVGIPNLNTSGLGLTEARSDQLSVAGLDHVQPSVQGARAASADHVSGYDGGHARKMAVAG